jgi:hypothetical protein
MREITIVLVFTRQKEGESEVMILTKEIHFLVSQAFRLNPVFLVLQKFKSHLLRVRFQFFLKILKISTDNEGRHPECTQPSKNPELTDISAQLAQGRGVAVKKDQPSSHAHRISKAKCRLVFYYTCLAYQNTS